LANVVTCLRFIYISVQMQDPFISTMLFFVQIQIALLHQSSNMLLKTHLAAHAQQS